MLELFFKPYIMIKAYSGTLLVEPNLDTTGFSIDSPQDGRKILSGKILDIGSPKKTEFGQEISCELHVGQTIYFLSYNDDYDNMEVDNKKQYFVLFADVRGFEE